MVKLRPIVLAAACLLALTAAAAYPPQPDPSVVRVAEIAQRIVAVAPHVEPETAQRYATAIYASHVETGVEVGVIIAVMQTESHFAPGAVSTAGALGLMQVMPFWATKKVFPFLTSAKQLLDPELNIRTAAHILDHYADVCGERMLACYHGGPKARFKPKKSTVAYVNQVKQRITNI